MTRFYPIVAIWSGWLDAVATFLLTLRDRVASPAVFKFEENERGELILQRGLNDSSQQQKHCVPCINDRINFTADPDLAAQLQRSHVELTLQPQRFTFKSLELPSRAADFLDGLVRAQIDRLTPWSSGEAAFGWSEPVKNDEQRIVVNVAATAQSFLRPYLEALAKAGVHSMSIVAAPPTASFGGMPIKVWEERTRQPLKFTRVRQILVGTLILAIVTGPISLGASALVGARYDAEREEIDLRISRLTSAAKSAAHLPMTTPQSVRQSLSRRKNATVPSVVVLEILSRILPEHTYVTELRIEDNKVRLIGVTKDAPSLIALIERSRFFSRASFFAPTTRSPSQVTERFHIEVLLQELGAARS
jgi:general secretion pathway protein L